MLEGINRRNQFSCLVVTDEVMLDFSPYRVQACPFLSWNSTIDGIFPSIACKFATFLAWSG
jgi:hypothetical protein